MLQIVNNKHYTWDDVVREYPDKWVVFENFRLNMCRFIEGDLIAVGDSEEIDAFVVECYRNNRNVIYQRTTEIGGVDLVYVEGIEIRVK